ncbi:MAG: phospholipid carrier-dependent glycosyltransferase [Burkholderiaceae bacterium]|nr:phospholipid carrier-dependent glycosyltransferase [Burkholderiaceae bacterium]
MTKPRESQRYPRHAIYLIIGVFSILCAIYNVSFPPFEGGDEVAHFLTASSYASRGALPDLNNAPAHEAAQPPLYYGLVALAIAPIDRSDFARAYARNPDNGNGFHIATRPTPETSRVPPTGSVLALRIARYISGLFGAIVVALTASTAWILFRRPDITLFAPALIAFNPRFIHMSSTMTNDIAVAAGAAAAIWLAVRVSKGYRPPNWPILVALGAACGAAALSKYSGLATLAPAGVALIWRALGIRHNARSPSRSLLGMCMLTAVGFFAVTAWFFLHNIVNYGDALAWEQVRALNSFSQRLTPSPIGEILAQWPTMLATSWGSFGYGARMPFSLEQALVTFSYVAAVGVMVALVRRQATKRVGLLVVLALAVAIAWASWTRSYGGTDNARLMAPAAIGVAIVCAMGALAWFPDRTRGNAAVLATLLLSGISFAMPWTTLIPAYSLPVALSTVEVARLPVVGRVLYAQGIELMKAELEQSRISSGNPLRVRLLWRATRPMDRAYVRVVEAIDQDGRSLGREDRPPLGAKLSTRFWEVGAVYEETVVIPVETGPMDNPSMAGVFVGWHEHNPPYELVRVAGSEAVSAQVGAFRLKTSAAPGPASAASIAVFGSVAQLEVADVTTDDARLVFRATGEPNTNLTIFIHGYDASGALIAQEDFPVNPSAPLWLAGDRMTLSQRVKGLGGAARVGIGVYDPATNDRLPAFGAGGARFANDIAFLR